MQRFDFSDTGRVSKKESPARRQGFTGKLKSSYYCEPAVTVTSTRRSGCRHAINFCLLCSAQRL